MTVLRQMSVTGGLYAAKAGRELRLSPDEWALVDGVTVSDVDVGGWCTLIFRSKKALLNEPKEVPKDYYEYYYFFRRSGPHFLLVSSHGTLVEVMLRHSRVASQVVSPVVDVVGIVRDFADEPEKYNMTRVYAWVGGSGHSLRSMTLYGNDLADSKLFHGLLPNLRPYRVNLRDLTSMVEVISIASRGEISFNYAGVDTLRNVDAALHFLSDKKYLRWD